MFRTVVRWKQTDGDFRRFGDPLLDRRKFIVMGKPQFIAEEVKVREAGPGEPVSFLWRGQEYRIVEVVGVKRHLDFRRPWWQRRHRDYYRVRTDTGQTFELYFHRGPGRKYWVLYKEVGDAR